MTFVIALTASFGIVQLFDQPIAAILQRLIADELSVAWHQYIIFAAYVAGVSGGVRVYQLERYISAPQKNQDVLVLNAERWTLEAYRTIIKTLQSIAWLLLVVFLVALIANVIVQISVSA